MSLVDALILSVIGMAVVFVVLMLLMFIVRIMGLLAEKSTVIAGKMPSFLKKKKVKTSTQTDTESEDLKLAEGSIGDLVLKGTDERDAAMIMAIVADATVTPLNQLRFKSIKRIDSEEK